MEGSYKRMRSLLLLAMTGASPVHGELEHLAMDSQVCHPGGQIADALLHLLLMLEGPTLLLLLLELHARHHLVHGSCYTKPRHNALQYHGVMAPSFESLSHASRSLRTDQTLAGSVITGDRTGKITVQAVGKYFVDCLTRDCLLM